MSAKARKVREYYEGIRDEWLAGSAILADEAEQYLALVDVFREELHRDPVWLLEVTEWRSA